MADQTVTLTDPSTLPNVATAGLEVRLFITIHADNSMRLEGFVADATSGFNRQGSIENADLSPALKTAIQNQVDTVFKTNAMRKALKFI